MYQGNDGPGNGHTKALCQSLTGFTLIINKGHGSRENQRSISEQKQYNASQRGPRINISAALQSDTALQAFMDVRNDNYSLFKNKPLLNGIW